jgi:hypothetical protein
VNYTDVPSDEGDNDDEGEDEGEDEDEDDEVLAEPVSSSLDTRKPRAHAGSKRVSSQVSSCKVPDSGASDDGGAVRSRVCVLDDQHLQRPQNLGKYVLYVYNTSTTDELAGETFFMLGVIDKIPQWGDKDDDDETLYFHTQDMHCTEDSNWPLSLVDGYFHKPAAKKASVPEPNWLDLTREGTLVLALFTSLNADGRLNKPTRERAQAVLEEHRHLGYIADFLNRRPEDRPKRKGARAPKARPSKRKRS